MNTRFNEEGSQKHMKRKIKVIIQFILNPRFLICFGLAWLLTNGWSYIALALGTLFQIQWMIAVAGAYMALLWFPFTPEKVITIIIAMALLRWLFPNDEKTLGILKELYAKAKQKIKQRRAAREKQTNEQDESK